MVVLGTTSWEATSLRIVKMVVVETVYGAGLDAMLVIALLRMVQHWMVQQKSMTIVAQTVMEIKLWLTVIIIGVVQTQEEHTQRLMTVSMLEETEIVF